MQILIVISASLVLSSYIVYLVIYWFGRLYNINTATLRDVKEIKIDANNTIIKCTVKRLGVPSFKLEILKQGVPSNWTTDLLVDAKFYDAATGKKIDIMDALDKYNKHTSIINKIKEIEDLKIKALMEGVE